MDANMTHDNISLDQEQDGYPLATPEQLRYCAARIRLGCRYTQQAHGNLFKVSDEFSVAACALGALIIGGNDPLSFVQNRIAFVPIQYVEHVGFNVSAIMIRDDDHGEHRISLSNYIIDHNDIQGKSREEVADILDALANELDEQHAAHTEEAQS